MNLTKHDRKVLIDCIKPYIIQTFIIIFFAAIISLFAFVAMDIVESDTEKEFNYLVKNLPYFFLIVSGIIVLIISYLKARNYILDLRKANKIQVEDIVVERKSDDRYAFDTTVRANNLILEEYFIELKKKGTIEIDKDLYNNLIVGDKVLLCIAPLSQKILDCKKQRKNL